MESREWPAKIEALSLFIDNVRQDASLKDKFEQGVAIAEVLDLINNGVELASPGPTNNTEELRVAVASTLADCSGPQKLELCTLLEEKFQSVIQDINPPAVTTEAEVDDGGPTISHDEYLQLREKTGIGTSNAWSHLWNRARSLGLLNESGELSIAKLSASLTKWGEVGTAGVSSATLKVGRTVVKMLEDH